LMQHNVQSANSDEPLLTFGKIPNAPFISNYVLFYP